jgi:hypothetical protein
VAGGVPVGAGAGWAAPDVGHSAIATRTNAAAEKRSRSETLQERSALPMM